MILDDALIKLSNEAIDALNPKNKPKINLKVLFVKPLQRPDYNSNYEYLRDKRRNVNKHLR